MERGKNTWWAKCKAPTLPHRYEPHQGSRYLTGLWQQTCASTPIDVVKRSFLVCGISNSLDECENKLVRVAAEFPNFTIPYGVEGVGDESESDLFLSSE